MRGVEVNGGVFTCRQTLQTLRFSMRQEGDEVQPTEG